MARINPSGPIALRLAGLAGAFFMSLGSTACQQDSDNASERDGSLVAGVLNGQDDRKELYELDSGGNRDILEGGVAALMWEHRIDYAHPTTLRAVSAGEALSLCADERFAEQPAAAFCSAVLIDDDLILTAGHCLGDTMEAAEDSCKRLLVVFDYYYSGPGELALASADDIYACRQVAFHVHSHLEGNSSDVAVLQLDRKVNAKRQPVALREERPQVGESLIAAATGVGLPLKVDLGGAVVEIRPGADYFVAATDSFEGGSGSPLFSAAMALIGFQVRGAPDWVAGDGCWRSSHSDPPMEQHQLAERAIEDFCGTGWPSERLCRRAPACGDGVCSGPETIQSCAEDCRAPRCGDWICEPSERANCRDDCSAYANVPAEWLLDPVLYPLAAPASVGDPKTPRGGCSMPPNVGTRLSHSLAWLALLTTLVLSRRRCFSDMPRFT